MASCILFYRSQTYILEWEEREKARGERERKKMFSCMSSSHSTHSNVSLTPTLSNYPQEGMPIAGHRRARKAVYPPRMYYMPQDALAQVWLYDWVSRYPQEG